MRSFWVFMLPKTLAGQIDPCPPDNVIPDLAWNRVKIYNVEKSTLHCVSLYSSVLAFYSQQRPFCGIWRSKNGLRMLSMAKRLGSMSLNSPIVSQKYQTNFCLRIVYCVEKLNLDMVSVWKFEQYFKKMKGYYPKFNKGPIRLSLSDLQDLQETILSKSYKVDISTM